AHAAVRADGSSVPSFLAATASAVSAAGGRGGVSGDLGQGGESKGQQQLQEGVGGLTSEPLCEWTTSCPFFTTKMTSVLPREVEKGPAEMTEGNHHNKIIAPRALNKSGSHSRGRSSFVSPRVVSRSPHDDTSPSGQHTSDGQEHPVSYLFVGSRGHLPDIVTVARLRATSRRIRAAFTIAELRTRLANSLSRDGDGINTQHLQLVQFDPSLGMGELMAAVWIAEEGGRWEEMREVLQWASQCRYCTLPLNLTTDDINTHANKAAYGSVARVLAQFMMVGRHVDFGKSSRLQIFRHGNGEVRAIKDTPGFRLDVNPPLPGAGHLYERHRLEHDPPVHSEIFYSGR
ncbi:unnamed protein product, partial [Vitrella brassicaformis CCMP3155]